MFEKWLAEVFTCPDWLTLLSIAGKTAVIYVFVVAGIRILGTRELGRLNAYDFVLVVVIANAVQNALVGGDNTLVGGLVSADEERFGDAQGGGGLRREVHESGVGKHGNPAPEG